MTNPNPKTAPLRIESEDDRSIRDTVRALRLAPSLADEMIAEGLTLKEARERILGDMGSGRIEVGDSEKDKQERAAVAALTSRLGLTSQFAAHANSQIPEVAAAFADCRSRDTGGEFQGMALGEIARDTLARRGLFPRRGPREYPADVIERALQRRDAGGQETSSDFTLILKNLLFRVALNAYLQASAVWREVTDVRLVKDFKPVTFIVPGNLDPLLKTNEGQEIPTVQVPDVTELPPTTLNAHNAMINISRLTILNDNLQVLADRATMLGKAAALSVEGAFFDLLLAASGLGPTVTVGGITAPMIDAQFGNAGAGSTLDLNGLQADRLLMTSQVDRANKIVLDLRPKTLLVPSALEGKAAEIVRAFYTPDGKPLVSGGLVGQIISSPRLTGTRRWLFSDPARAAAFVATFPKDQGSIPLFEERDGWNVDGVRFAVTFDFAMNPFDPKAMVSNAGQ